MSYCRFSSDNWNSDIYCYQSVDGYMIHVASNRFDRDITPLDESTEETLYESYRQQRKDIAKAKRIDIELEGAGESYCLPTPQEAVEKLKELQTKLKQTRESLEKKKQSLVQV